MTFKEFKDRLAGELGVALPDAEFDETSSIRNGATAVDGCVLQQLIRDALGNVVDADKMDEIIAKEDKEKDLLRKAVKNLRGNGK